MTELSELTAFDLLKREAEISFRHTRDVDDVIRREDDAAKLRAEMRRRGMIKGGAVSE